MDQPFARIESALKRLVWMLAINLTATVGIILMLLSALV
jgi:hypothetical protein